MNINYEEIRKQEFSDEVRQSYAFPEDKNFIKKRLTEKFMEDPGVQGVKDLKDEIIICSMATAAAFGFYHFNYLMGPQGKVLRDLKQSRMDSSRLFNRRYGAYAGLIVPCVLLVYGGLNWKSHFSE